MCTEEQGATGESLDLGQVRGSLSCPFRRPDVLNADAGVAVFLYDGRNTTVFEVNLTAHKVWRLCDGSHTVKEIALVLAREFDIEVSVAHSDVEDIIGEFHKVGLLSDPTCEMC